MLRGLVIGKFMPIHNGHIALVNFAASKCDELIVSISYTDTDPISGKLRFEWIIEIFKGNPSIKPVIVKDDFDDDSLPLKERTKLWSSFLMRRYPAVDVIISSEEYGPPLAEYLGASHITFDMDRTTVPISATMIRKHPLINWEFIPAVVRPYYVSKICIYGAESTGKSTIVEFLAEKYQTEFVPEVAREFITSNDFTVEDIIRIGIAHNQRITDKAKVANRLLFCDTDVITTQIYCRHYLGTIPQILYELERQTTYSKYFLMDIDVEWVADGLRDLSDSRQIMMNIFKEELDKRGIVYQIIRGPYRERERQICEVIDQMIME
ncbi:MAG: AAA family ATPase [Chryseolinea sp.]